MTQEHGEKQLHETYAYSSILKSSDDRKQERFSRINGLSRSRKFQSLWVTLLLLAFIALTYTLGIFFASSPSVHFFKSFTHKHMHNLKTVVPNLGTSSIRVICKGNSKRFEDNTCHENEAIIVSLRHTNINAPGRWSDLAKRAASNGSGIMEELPTAPPNIPFTIKTTTSANFPDNAPFTITTTIPDNKLSTVTTTATILPVSIGSTKTLVVPASATSSESTSATPESSDLPSNPAVKTLTSQKTISQLSVITVSTVESPELTTITGTLQDDDLPTSTTKEPNSSSSAWTTITKQTIFTTTLPDGAFSTFTSTTVIEADAKQTDIHGSSKTKPSASLQTNAARQIKSLQIEKAIGIFGLMMVGAW